MAMLGGGAGGGPTSDYLAGFIDGEGCIIIHMKRSRKGDKFSSHDIEVNISQKNKKILEIVKKQHGGYLYRNGTCWRLFWCQTKAVKILKKVYFSLIVKKNAAKLALCLAYLKKSRRRRNERLLIEERELRDKIKLRISYYNQRGGMD